MFILFVWYSSIIHDYGCNLNVLLFTNNHNISHLWYHNCTKDQGLFSVVRIFYPYPWSLFRYNISALVVLHCLFEQHTWFTSNDFGVEGYGYMTCWVTMCFMPYMFPMAARFLYMFPKEAVTNHYALAAFFIFNGTYCHFNHISYLPFLECIGIFTSGFRGTWLWIHVTHRVSSVSTLHLYLHNTLPVFISSTIPTD